MLNYSFPVYEISFENHKNLLLALTWIQLNFKDISLNKPKKNKLAFRTAVQTMGRK